MAWSLGPTAVHGTWTAPRHPCNPAITSLFKTRVQNLSGDLNPPTSEEVGCRPTSETQLQRGPRSHASPKPAAHRPPRKVTNPTAAAPQQSNMVHGVKGYNYGAGSDQGGRRTSGSSSYTCSTWRREPNEEVTSAFPLVAAAAAAGFGPTASNEHRQTFAQQPPCQPHPVAPSIKGDGFDRRMFQDATSQEEPWLMGRQKQRRHGGTGRTAQGPDALMRSIMNASTIPELHAALQGELQLASRRVCTAPSAATAAAASGITQAAASPRTSSAMLTEMRPIHVAAAIVRLSKLPCENRMAPNGVRTQYLPQPPEDLESQRLQLLDALLEVACAEALSLTARQLVNVIWALGRMDADKSNGTAAADATAPGDEGKASRTETQLELVAAIQVPSLTQIEILLSELLGQRVQLRWWVEIVEDLQQLAGEKDAAEEKLSMGSDIETSSGDLAAEFDPHRIHGEVVDTSPQRLRSRKLDQATNREVANLAWAAAQLRLESPVLWADVRSVVLQRLRNGNSEKRTRAAAGRGESGPDVFNAADLANLAWALARAPPLQQQHLGGHLAEGLVQAALKQMEAFDAVSLSGLIWGLGRLAGKSTPAMAALEVNGVPAIGSRDDGTPWNYKVGGDDGHCSGGSVVGASDDWVTRSDLLPLLLHRAVPRVVSELSQQRMRPQEVVSVALGLAAAARRPGGGAPVPSALLQVLADHVASATTAYVGGRVNEHGVRLDNLANVLLALVRCVERSDGGLNTDPRVARRVERALGTASKQVVRSLPRMSPESLVALAVAYSSQLTGRGAGGGSTFGSCVADAVAMGGGEGFEGPGDFIAACSSGLLPPPRSTAGTVIPPVRAAVLRAILRAAVRLLPALPLSTSAPSVPKPLAGITEPRAAVATLNGAEGCNSSGGDGGGRGPLSVRHIREVVGLLWWCAQGLGGGAGGGVLEELHAAAPWIERALPLCRPADLALLAATYTRANCHPPSLEAALSAAVHSNASALSPLDVAQLAWAAAAAPAATQASGSRNALMLSVLEQRCTELLRSGVWSAGQELAVVMWAFAKLNHYSEPMLDAVAGALRSSSAAPATPSMAAAAPPPPLPPPPLPSSPTKGSSSSSSSSATSGAVRYGSSALSWQHPPQPLLLRLQPQEVAMIAAALGQLRYYDAQLMRLLAACIEAEVDRYSARVLTWALSAFACLNSHHPGLLRAATARVRQLLQFHSHPLPSSSRYPHSHHDHTRSQSHAQKAEAAQIGSQQDLVSEHVQEDDGTQRLLPFDAVALLWSFGVLQHVDMDCLQGLIRILPRDPRVYSISDLSRLGLADAMLRGALERRNGRYAQALHANAAKGGGGATSTSSAAINVAALTSSGDGGVRLSANDADPMAAAVALQGGLLPEQLQQAVVRTAGSQRSRVSNLQREVATELRGMGLRPKLEVAMGVFSLDLRLDLPEGWTYNQQASEQQQDPQKRKRQPPPPPQEQEQQGRQSSRRGKGSVGSGVPMGSETPASGASGGDGCGDAPSGLPPGGAGSAGAIVRIAVEVDGPSHFCANVANHALGGTVARDRCLLDQGLQLVVVPHFEWDVLQSPKAKRSYLARRLAAAAASSRDEEEDDEEEDDEDDREHHTEGAVVTAARAGVGGRKQQRKLQDGHRVHSRLTKVSRALFPAITVTTQVVRRGSLPVRVMPTPTPTRMPAAVVPAGPSIPIATAGAAVADTPAAAATTTGPHFAVPQ